MIKNGQQSWQEKLRTLAESEIGAMIVRPASIEELKACNTELAESDLPELPGDYAEFLKTCNGYAFDSVELYGTNTSTGSNFQLIDLVTATEDFNEYYEEYLNLGYDLLCIGRKNGDYLTYDPETRRYQVRDHETACTDVWEEYDTFGAFFLKEA